MLVFGFGISTDVNSLTFAVLDRDNSFESRAWLEELRGSPYFIEQPPLRSAADLRDRLKQGKTMATIEIPPGFGRDIRRGRPAEIGVWIDGAMPFRAETIRGYLLGLHEGYLEDRAIHGHLPAAEAAGGANIEIRFRYNQHFDSVYAMVPTQIALQLALIPAILMALAIVREKELGSIVNLYVTPVTRLEFLLGKQIPYIGLAMVNFLMMFLMAIWLFEVPLKGSFLLLALGALIYVTATTAYGRVISTFTGSQIAALFGTAILTVLPATMFAGMMVPVSSLTGARRPDGPAVPDDLLRADQRRHLHQGAGLRRPLGQPAGAAGLRAGADRCSASSCCRARRGERHARALDHLLAVDQGAAQLLPRLGAVRPGDLRLLARHHRPGAEQHAGAAQRLDRRRRRGPFGAVAAHRRRLPAALLQAAGGGRARATSTT